MPSANLVKIQRRKPVDPKRLLGDGWSFWRGPREGSGLGGDVEQDTISVALASIDPQKMYLRQFLSPEERSISGEEFYRRLLLCGAIRLDAAVLLHLLEFPSLFPSAWRAQTDGNTTFVYFFGSIFRSPEGNRCVLRVYDSGGALDWRCIPLSHPWATNDVAAILL